MLYRPLGATGLQVSGHTLGTLMLGPAGNPDRRECIDLVHAALDHGINLIDTADSYSAGESEEIVGEALVGRRDNVLLATKGHFPEGEGPNRGGNSRRWMVRAVEASLRRLRTDHIDVYQVHRPDESTDVEETLSALTDLVRDGKIGTFGCSTFPADLIVDAHHVSQQRGLGRFRTEQPPYSLLTRGVERDVLPMCADLGMGVLTWAPLASGFLTGRYRRDDPVDLSSGRSARRPGDFDPDAPGNATKYDAVEALSAVARDAGCSLPHLAVAFAATHPAVSSVVIGPRTRQQLDNLVAGADLELGDDVLDAIDAIVTPGTDLYEPPGTFRRSALTDPNLRRRRQGLRSVR